MTLSPVTLESFEEDGPQSAPESADFKRGYEAGLAAANGTHEAMIARAVQDVSSTLNDMNFGFEEARLHLITKLRPLLIQLSEAALPDILNLSFGAHLNETIEKHFGELAEDHLTISVSEDVASQLEDQLSAENPRFTFAPDPSLAAGQAIIKGGDAHVMLDLPALLQSLQTALSGLETIQRMENHG